MGLAYAQLGGAMALVGANVAVGKMAVAYLPVFVFAFIRFAAAALALWPFARHEPGAALLSLPRPVQFDLFWQAFFGLFLFMLFLLHGLRFTSAVNAGIITSTVPAVVALLAVLMLGERLGRRGAIALGFAVLGIAAVNTASAEPEISPHPMLGNVLIAAAVVSESLFVIYAKRVAARIPPYRMALAINLIGLVLVAPFALVGLASLDLGAVPPAVWVLPVFYGLTSSVVALILWYRGLALVPASRAAVMTSALPVTAVAVSIAVLGEPLEWAHGLGLIAVLIAIILGATEGPLPVFRRRRAQGAE